MWAKAIAHHLCFCMNLMIPDCSGLIVVFLAHFLKIPKAFSPASVRGNGRTLSCHSAVRQRSNATGLAFLILCGDKPFMKNQWMNIGAMMLGQGSSLAANMVSVSFAALIGIALAPDPSLATLPQALLLVATAATTGIISGIMGRYGRRAGFITGAVTAFFAVSLAISAIIAHSFILFCFATFLLGTFNAAGQYYRFAAAESVSIEQAPKAISLVLLGGIAAALTVPTITNWADQSLNLPNHGGAFASVILYASLGIIAPLLARFTERDDRPDGPNTIKISLSEIFKRPAFITGMVTTAGAQALMNLLMTATPIAMRDAGHQAYHSTDVIQAHVIAMFLPSLFSGWFISKLGVGKVVTIGIFAMTASVLTARSGLAVGHFTASLILLGVGWNFLFVSGTSIVASSHKNHERARIQGVNEMAVFGSSAIAALASGALLNTLSWAGLALSSTVLIAAIALVNIRAVLAARRLKTSV